LTDAANRRCGGGKNLLSATGWAFMATHPRMRGIM
jgi:hypothetical protein